MPKFSRLRKNNWEKKKKKGRFWKSLVLKGDIQTINPHLVPVNSRKWISAPLDWGNSPARSEDPALLFFLEQAGRAQFGVINLIKPKCNYLQTELQGKHRFPATRDNSAWREDAAQPKNFQTGTAKTGHNPAGKRTAKGLGQKAKEIKISTSKAGRILWDTIPRSTTRPCHEEGKEGFVSMSLQFLHNRSSSWGYLELMSTALTPRSTFASWPHLKIKGKSPQQEELYIFN